MRTRKTLHGPVCPTCGFEVPAWTVAADGKQKLEETLRVVKERPGLSTAKVAEAIGWKKGLTYSLLSTLVREGKIQAVLQPTKPNWPRARLWIPTTEGERREG